MTAGQLAALIAAVAFAVLAAVAVAVLLRLARLLTAAAAMLAQYRARSERLHDSAAAAVRRADDQLARTAALSEQVDQVTASMAELSAQAAAAAATARTLSELLAAPLLRLAAFRFGLGHAAALRRQRRSGSGGGRPGRGGRASLDLGPDLSARASAPGRSLPAPATSERDGRDRLHSSGRARLTAARVADRRHQAGP